MNRKEVISMSVTPIDVPVSHAEAARQLSESLRAMQSTIEGFVLPPQPLDAQSRLRGHRSLPDAFFLELAVAMESSVAFVNALAAASLQLTPAEIRDMLRYGEAYLPFADALERFARGVRHTVFARRASVGRKASSAYRIAQGMNLLVDVSLPVPQAESMKRAFATRTRRRKPAPVPEPVPAPAGKATR
jgi:hypothetical protein